jgi:hypothetical protein
VRQIHLTYLAGKANGRVQHLGSLVSLEEQQRYGLQATEAPACALRQAPATGLSLFETLTVMDHDAFWGAVAPAFNAFIAHQEQGGTA